MRIDRTWTFSFDEYERSLLLQELQIVKLPDDLGWKPLLTQFASARQITLPLRAIERLSLELDITRSQFTRNAAYLDYTRKFPQIAALTAEIDLILYSYKRKSA